MVSCLMGDSTVLASAIVRCCHILSKEQSITDLSSTDSIPFHSLNPLPFAHGEAATPPERKRTEAKSNSAVEIYREIIKDNIEYDHLIQNCKIDKDRLDEIVDLRSKESPCKTMPDSNHRIGDERSTRTTSL